MFSLARYGGNGRPDSPHRLSRMARVAIMCVAAGTAVTVAPAAAHASPAAVTAVDANQPARSAVALAMDAGGNGFAFYRGQGDAVYMRTITSAGAWSPQLGIGGIIVGAPAAAIIPGGVIVAARGTDGALWLRQMRNGSWGPWYSWGGIISASPAITAASDSRVDVFGRGADGALWTRTMLGGQQPGPWRSLGGKLVTGPAAAASGSGSINVTAIGTDNAVWTRTLSGGAWSPWASIGGRTYSAPAVAWAPQSSQRSVFVRGTDNALWVATFGPGATGWRSMGGILIDSPGAAASAAGLDVAVRGADNAVWQTLYRAGRWSLPYAKVWTPAAPAAPASSLLGIDWTRIPTSAKVVALTFDAGANAAGLPSIDATLRAKIVPATFSLTGAWVRQFPAQAGWIAAGGYAVTNHSMTHPYFTLLTDAQVAAQVLDAQQAILTSTGQDPRPLFRFPYGDVNSRVIGDVNRLGYVPVRWTVDTLGWEGTTAGQSTQTVINRVLAALQPGEIVLMHIGSAPDGSTLDAAALPTIINSIRARGYTFVTLHALTG